MTAIACNRSWQAEAMVDGRLSPQDARSFKRHSAGCPACQRELAVLAAMSDAGQSVAIPERTELERRRARHELLRRANALSLDTRSRKAPLWTALAAAIAALAFTAFVFLRTTPRAPGSPVVEAPTYRVVAGAVTSWTTLERGATARLGLTSGHLEIAVDKLRADQRFLVQLPDGELEVRGTRFTIDVDGGSTRSVRVTEGAVALALRGQPERLLEQGGVYSRTREKEPAPAGSAPAPTAGETAGSPEPAASASVASTPAALPSSAAARHRAAPASSAISELASPPAPPVTIPTFAQAMTAFGAGDYGRAESLFLAFERENPGDARIEDTTFLRAVARKRRGDGDGAAAAAREYLRRYPAGFRRSEAERLLR